MYQIGAHLLEMKPNIINPDADIFIQEVHVPSGTLMQRLNFTLLSSEHDGFSELRLLDFIPEDCFKKAHQPSSVDQQEML